VFDVDPHQFSWLREVVIPAIFVALGAVLGTGLGLLASALKNRNLSEMRANLIRDNAAIRSVILLQGGANQ
jgi:hypothetical protein